ncbi:hypothetical protein AB0393_38750, partial [Streptomyces cyaneofuscatus]
MLLSVPPLAAAGPSAPGWSRSCCCAPRRPVLASVAPVPPYAAPRRAAPLVEVVSRPRRRSGLAAAPGLACPARPPVRPAPSARRLPSTP